MTEQGTMAHPAPPSASDCPVAHTGQSATASAPPVFTTPRVSIPQTSATNGRSITINTAHTKYFRGPEKSQSFVPPYTTVAYGVDGSSIGTGQPKRAVPDMTFDHIWSEGQRRNPTSYGPYHEADVLSSVAYNKIRGD